MSLFGRNLSPVRLGCFHVSSFRKLFWNISLLSGLQLEGMINQGKLSTDFKLKYVTPNLLSFGTNIAQIPDNKVSLPYGGNVETSDGPSQTWYKQEGTQSHQRK